MWRPPAFLYHPDAVLIVERVAGCRSVQVGSSPVQEFDHANLAEGCSPGAIGLTLKSTKPLTLASPVVSSFSTPLTSRPSMSMRRCLADVREPCLRRRMVARSRDSTEAAMFLACCCSNGNDAMFEHKAAA